MGFFDWLFGVFGAGYSIKTPGLDWDTPPERAERILMEHGLAEPLEGENHPISGRRLMLMQQAMHEELARHRQQYLQLMHSRPGTTFIFPTQQEAIETSRQITRHPGSVQQLPSGALAGLGGPASLGQCGVGGLTMTPEEYHQNQQKYREKAKKAENKAILLLQNLIGVEQCDIYRKTRRLLVRPNKWTWIIGNLSGALRHQLLAPGVIRIDNPKKLHVTFFCVVSKSSGHIPYTDKVITFATHLLNDEKSFVKTVNRIEENTLAKMPECAVMKK